MRTLLVLALCLLGIGLACNRPPQPAADRETTTQEAPAGPTIVRTAPADIGPRFRAQLKRLLSLRWQLEGAWPERIETLQVELTWQPDPPVTLRTITMSEVGTLGPQDYGYIPSTDPAVPPQLVFLAEGVNLEPLDGPMGLAAKSAELLAAATTPIPELIADPSLDAEHILRRMLWAKTPREAPRAAAAHYSIRALFEWVIAEREGVWPQQSGDLLGATIIAAGSVPGLEMYVDREGGMLYTNFILPGEPVWVVATQIVQTEGSGAWLSISTRHPTGTALPDGLWRLL